MSLPKPQFDTLDYLLNFMCELAANESATAMGPENLGVVFSPNLLRTGETDPSILFKNEGKVRNFVKNAVLYWMKNKPVIPPGAATAALTAAAAKK